MHVLCPENKPEIADRATTVDIRNHIYRAQRACQLSKLDQENLQLKIDHWRKESPQTFFYFRPYKSSDSELNPKEFSSESSNNFSQTLLYIHQEPWQQQLLNRCGNTITHMDTTYKTTRYELALFFFSCESKCRVFSGWRIRSTIRKL